jgi:hypothetical protein
MIFLFHLCRCKEGNATGGNHIFMKSREEGMIMKRVSLLVMGIAILFLSIGVVLSSCGGGGGGGGVTLQPPAYNLTGNWHETQTFSQPNDCPVPAENHDWSMSQQSGSNTVTGGYIGQPQTTNFTMSGNTLSVSLPIDIGVPNASCTASLSVGFTSSTHGSGSVTLKCSDNSGNSCTTVFNEIFDKI